MLTVTDPATELRTLAAKLTELTKAREAARDRLRDALKRRIDAGDITEVEAARIVGVNRQTVRAWTGKQDSRNRPIPKG